MPKKEDAQFQRLDGVEKLDHFFVRPVAEGAEKSRREKLPPAFAAVEIDIQQVAGVELDFDPGTAVRNNPEAVEDLAVQMDRRFERNAR